jgi:hypothetical protein
MMCGSYLRIFRFQMLNSPYLTDFLTTSFFLRSLQRYNYSKFNYASQSVCYNCKGHAVEYIY